jgi:hypothetical protein
MAVINTNVTMRKILLWRFMNKLPDPDLIGGFAGIVPRVATGLEFLPLCSGADDAWDFAMTLAVGVCRRGDFFFAAFLNNKEIGTPFILSLQYYIGIL